MHKQTVPTSQSCQRYTEEHDSHYLDIQQTHKLPNAQRIHTISPTCLLKKTNLSTLGSFRYSMLHLDPALFLLIICLPSCLMQGTPSHVYSKLQMQTLPYQLPLNLFISLHTIIKLNNDLCLRTWVYRLHGCVTNPWNPNLWNWIFTRSRNPFSTLKQFTVVR